MQHYTTIEQSKKLVELGLNPNNADMIWTPLNWQLTEYYAEVKQDDINTPKNPIPCWSLGALINTMPSLISHGKYDSTLGIYKYGEFRVCYQNMYHLDEVWYTKECLLDAVFEMVCWLLENGYIKKGE